MSEPRPLTPTEYARFREWAKVAGPAHFDAAVMTLLLDTVDSLRSDLAAAREEGARAKDNLTRELAAMREACANAAEWEGIPRDFTPYARDGSDSNLGPMTEYEAITSKHGDAIARAIRALSLLAPPAPPPHGAPGHDCDCEDPREVGYETSQAAIPDPALAEKVRAEAVARGPMPPAFFGGAVALGDSATGANPLVAGAAEGAALALAVAIDRYQAKEDRDDPTLEDECVTALWETYRDALTAYRSSRAGGAS